MALSIENDILAVMFRTRDAIKANLEEKGINASGRTSASIRVEVDGTHYRVMGGTRGTHEVPGGEEAITTADTAPIPTLELGRPGGKVPKGFYHIIKEWTREKGMSFGSERERGTFAYFVARKIARAGTRRNQDPENVYSEPVNVAIADIRKVLTAGISGAIHAEISRLQGVS